MLFIRDTSETGRRKKGIFQANAKKASSTIHIKQNGIQDEIYQEEQRETFHTDRKNNSLKGQSSHKPYAPNITALLNEGRTGGHANTC